MVACINNLRPSLKSESLGLTCQPVYHTLFQASEVSYLKLKEDGIKLKRTRNRQHCLLTYTQVHISLYTHKHACTNMYKYNENIPLLMDHLCSVLAGHLSNFVFLWLVLPDHWFESSKAVNQMGLYFLRKISKARNHFYKWMKIFKKQRLL